MAENPRNLADVCELAARAGGQALIGWQGRFETRLKRPADLVTDADLASQEAIRGVIGDHFPGHLFVGEEGDRPVEIAGDRYCWIVDPLDGTTNYVHGFPFYSVSVAVLRGQHLLAGVIFDPLTNDCFKAIQGEGAWLGDTQLAVSDTTALSKSLVAVSFPPLVAPDSPDMRSFVEIARRCRAVRRTGSCALNLAHVAAGNLDAFWAHSINPWDVAAGVLLVTESGGTVTAADGEPFDVWRAHFTAAATAQLHAEILPFVRDQR